MADTIEHATAHQDRPRRALSAWLWKPWYAKLWWTGIPVWWLGMAASTKVESLAGFYSGALAGFLNVLFLPMTALVVLGAGFVREWMDGFVGQGDRSPLTDEEEEDFVSELAHQEHMRFMAEMKRGTNIYDPLSGGLWVGNPNNPNNGSYINPHRHHHS